MQTQERCHRCILPTTFPGITFDGEGVCNLCSSYVPRPALGEEKLRKILSRQTGTSYDCIVPLSGGKDSTYILYYAVKVLALRVIAVNWDSGFQSELAVENQKRACEILDVPLVVHKSHFPKRVAVLKEVLRIANIVGVPFGVCRNCETSLRAVSAQVAKAHNVPTILWGASQVEDAPPVNFEGARGLIKRAGIAELAQLLKPLVRCTAILAYERRQLGLSMRYICNPFKAIPFPSGGVKFVHFFDYIPWASMDKEELLGKEVGWHHPKDRLDRFDCFLHPLDNYKWLREAGITKDGYLYSNMIRAGAMTRENALICEQILEEKLRQECYEFVQRFGYESLGVDWLRPGTSGR
jgi:hypothetical protein